MLHVTSKFIFKLPKYPFTFSKNVSLTEKLFLSNYIIMSRYRFPPKPAVRPKIQKQETKEEEVTPRKSSQILQEGVVLAEPSK
jgi:hypothetical protein